MRNTALWLIILAVTLPGVTCVHAEEGPTANRVSAFVSVDAHATTADSAGRDGALHGVADLLMSYKTGRWRVLGEFVAATEEQELERAQLGYEVADNTVLWLGRFHQPSSFWNVSFHHGQFLQTSITRPAIEEWEDESGPLPNHIVGALLESFIPTPGPGAWKISAASGFSPHIERAKLIPYSPFTGSSADPTHVSLRLEWLPDALGEDVVGVSASRTRMEQAGLSGTVGAPVTVSTAGLFANLGFGRARALGDLMLIDTNGNATAPLQFRRHVAGYLQLEVEARPGLTLFARQEALSNAQGSQYLALLSAAQPVRRSIGGARWQLSMRNALSVELGQSDLYPAARTRDVRLQWSAVAP